MAIFTMTDCAVIVNGVTLSTRANKVTVTDSRAKVDVTAFGATHVANAKGLGEGSIEIDFYQDFSAGQSHATLSPLISSTTPVAVEVRATSAARSATNPGILLASALLFDYSALDGSIGDASMTTATFDNAPGGTGITYPTA
jgi:hypothetical protein